MTKSNYFSTKCVFGQLISLIDDEIISNAVNKTQSDKFTLSKLGDLTINEEEILLLGCMMMILLERRRG